MFSTPRLDQVMLRAIATRSVEPNKLNYDEYYKVYKLGICGLFAAECELEGLREMTNQQTGKKDVLINFIQKQIDKEDIWVKRVSVVKSSFRTEWAAIPIGAKVKEKVSLNEDVTVSGTYDFTKAKYLWSKP